MVDSCFLSRRSDCSRLDDGVICFAACKLKAVDCSEESKCSAPQTGQTTHCVTATRHMESPLSTLLLASSATWALAPLLPPTVWGLMVYETFLSVKCHIVTTLGTNVSFE